MTIGEYRAWLEGFEEALQGKAPNKAQWKKIKERLWEVSATVEYRGWAYPTYPWTWTSTDGASVDVTVNAPSANYWHSGFSDATNLT